MRDIIRYIFLVIAFGVVNSCALDEPIGTIQDVQTSTEVEFVARPTNFSKSSVSTKADPVDLEEIENTIYSAFFLVYDSNGRLIKYENLTDQITSGSVPSQTFKTEKGLENVTVCYVANLPESFLRENMAVTEEDLEEDSSLTDLRKLQNTVIEFKTTTSNLQHFKIDKPSESNYVGIPIIDVQDDRSATANPRCLPMFGFWNGDLTGEGTSRTIEIQVKRLFTKIGFTIKLNLDDPSATSSLHLESIVVNRIPRTVNLFPKETESDLAFSSRDRDFLDLDYSTIPDVDVTIQDKDEATFYFYVPEFIVFPNEDVVSAYKNDGKYKEQYKPDFLGKKKATNVQFTASLTNQGQELKVDYTIYLGENHLDNFSLKRNILYDNQILITGLSEGEGSIGVDHRVNIRYDGFVVAFQRATLLDSHFEVRPIRVKFAPDLIDANSKKSGDLKDGTLTIQVLSPDSDDPDDAPGWLRLERPNTNTTDQTYCLTGHINHNHTKRRYFTTNLVTETLFETGKMVSYNPFAGASATVQGDLEGNIPVWLYIDEFSAVSTQDYDAEGYRVARLRVKYTPNDPEASSITQDFTVQQRAIYPVQSTQSGSSNKIYGIEFFEEYLHDYDALRPEGEDWGAEGGEYYTSESGIEWGLDGVELSHLHRAAYIESVQDVSATTGNSTVDAFLSALLGLTNSLIPTLMTQQMDRDDIYSPYYDFYLSRDGANSSITSRDYAGVDFNVEIIQFLKDAYFNSDPKDPLYHNAAIQLDNIALSERAQSVIAYCYNKNKRNSSGGVDVLHWYAPSIDEIEDITFSAANEFDVFYEKMYWSCQPSYEKNQVLMEYDLYAYFSDPKKALFIIDDAIDADGISSGVGYYQADNVWRARATSALIEGGNVDSGVSDSEISNILTIYGSDRNYYDATYTPRTILGREFYTFKEFILNEEKSSSKWGTDNNGDGKDDGPVPTGKEIDYDSHPGNQPRKAEGDKYKNRVRCVYNAEGISLVQ